MSASATWKQSLHLTARSASARWPGIARLHRRFYEARFRAGRYHCGYSGRFAGFEAAERALPSGLSGFDHDAMADIDHYTTMAGDIEPMPATEYPVLFWLRGALDEGARTLLDLGGYVGHAFRQYDRYLGFPDDFRWTVFDLPHITRAGQAIAARRPTPRLRFTNDVDDCCGMDVLLAAGSLQYLPDNHLHERLKAWPKRPRHLIVQRTPLHARQSFVTIQSVITRTGEVSFCPIAFRRAPVSSTACSRSAMSSWIPGRSHAASTCPSIRNAMSRPIRGSTSGSAPEAPDLASKTRRDHLAGRSRPACVIRAARPSPMGRWRYSNCSNVAARAWRIALTA